MWLPTGGQIENGHMRISSLAHGKQRKKSDEDDVKEFDLFNKEFTPLTSLVVL